MDAAAAVRLARLRAGLTKRELARRAHTSPAAVVWYESGARDPTVSTLERLITATGHSLELAVRAPRRCDRETTARRVAQVLELAEHLPRRRAPRRMSYPPFGR